MCQYRFGRKQNLLAIQIMQIIGSEFQNYHNTLIRICRTCVDSDILWNNTFAFAIETRQRPE